MPAALDVDKEQVRMLVLEVGCAEAARRLGIAHDTVRQWACRGRWIADRPASQPLPPTHRRPVTLVATPAQALADAYRDDRIQTRLSMSRAARKAATTLEQRDGDELLTDGGQTLKTVAQATALIHGWSDQTQARVVVSLQSLEQAPEIETVIDPDPDHDPTWD